MTAGGLVSGASNPNEELQYLIPIKIKNKIKGDPPLSQTAGQMATAGQQLDDLDT